MSKDYGSYVNKLWHYDAIAGSRMLKNSLKAVYSSPGSLDFKTKDSPKTTVEVTYEHSDYPGFALPKPGPGLYGRKRRCGLYPAVTGRKTGNRARSMEKPPPAQEGAS